MWHYLALEAGVTVADRIREKVLTTFTALARSPGIGHKREDLTSLEVKFYPVYQLMIVYSHNPKTLQILGVIHGKRDVATVLSKRFAKE